jgi:hypothetical protein
MENSFEKNKIIYKHESLKITIMILSKDLDK